MAGAHAAYGYVAFRPTGLVVQVMERGALKKWNGKSWIHFVPNFADVIAVDWGFGPAEQVAATLAQMNAQESGGAS